MFSKDWWTEEEFGSGNGEGAETRPAWRDPWRDRGTGTEVFRMGGLPNPDPREAGPGEARVQAPKVRCMILAVLLRQESLFVCALLDCSS